MIARTRRVAAYLQPTTGTGPDGKPTPDRSFDQHTIDAEAAVDGWYTLLTNLPVDHAHATRVLLHHKDQPVIETSKPQCCHSCGSVSLSSSSFRFGVLAGGLIGRPGTAVVLSARHVVQGAKAFDLGEIGAHDP